VRFVDHAAYVRRFREVTQELVAAGFLLPEDADRMIAEAEASNVGSPEVCVPAPTTLPETGERANWGPYVQLAILVSLILVGAGLCLRRLTAAPR
jgi:hypothetical protein